MTEKTRKMALILFAAVAAVILAAVPFLSRGATADPVWENYAVVEEEGKTVGIDIDDSFEGALQFDIPAGMTETNTANTQGVLTIKLDCPVAFDGSDGMLIQLATPGEGDRGIRVFLEDADGIYYILFATAAGGNETFVNEDGTVSHFPRAAYQTLLPGGLRGTWQVPWENVRHLENTAASTGPAAGTVFTRLHIARDMRTAGKAFFGRPLVIGTVASYAFSEAGAVVERAAATADMSYTFDGAESAKDVNLTNIRKGVRAYSTHSVTGSTIRFDTTPGETMYCIAKIRLSRYSSFSVTVSYADEENNAIADRNVYPAYYGEEKADGAKYSVPQYHKGGYTFLSSDKPLTGTLESDLAITQKFSAGNAYENYNVLKDGTKVSGVQIYGGLEGTVKFSISPEAEINTNTSGIVTFELGAVDTAETLGLAIRLGTTDGVGSRHLRLFVEDEAGCIYRMFPLAPMEPDAFVTAEGELTSVASGNFKNEIAGGMDGTMYIPWEKVNVLQGTGGFAVGRTLTKLHICMLASPANKGLPLEVGTIGLVYNDGGSAALSKILDTAEMTYAPRGAADVATLDLTQGTRIYAVRSLYNTMVRFDATVDEAVAANAAFIFTRSDAALTVHHRCGSAECETGDSLLGTETLKLTFDPAACVYAYEVKAGNFRNHVLDTSSGDALSGTVKGNAEIVLVYREKELPPPYTLTLSFVDQDGEAIADDRIMTVYSDADGLSHPYSVTPPEIHGAEFVSADHPLTGNLTEDTAIVLVYERFTGFEVITESNAVAGIRLTATLSGALDIGTIEKPVGVGSGTTGSSGLITFEFGRALDTALSTGFLLKFYAPDQLYVRIFLEDENGNIYQTFAVNNNPRTDAVAGDDGEIYGLDTTVPENAHLFTANLAGTWFCPWNSVISFEKGGSVMPAGTKLVKIHIGREMRSGQILADKHFIVGSFATVLIDGTQVSVDPVFDTAEYAYTYDAGNASADVNLADITQGVSAYSKHSYMYVLTFDGDPAATPLTTANFILRRYAGVKLTLKFVDETGKSIGSEEQISLEYGEDGIVYSVTPREIVGYEFLSADRELSGTVEEDGAITLTYRTKTFSIIVEFVDGEGNPIRENRVISVRYKDLFEIVPDEIEGYTYREATSVLKGTAVRDLTVRLYYEKTSGAGCDCSGSLFSDCTVLSLAVLAAAAFAFRMKKKR